MFLEGDIVVHRGSRRIGVVQTDCSNVVPVTVGWDDRSDHRVGFALPGDLIRCPSREEAEVFVENYETRWMRDGSV